MFNLDTMKVDNTVVIGSQPKCLEWLSQFGALLCGDDIGQVHLF